MEGVSIAYRLAGFVIGSFLFFFSERAARLWYAFRRETTRRNFSPPQATVNLFRLVGFVVVLIYGILLLSAL